MCLVSVTYREDVFFFDKIKTNDVEIRDKKTCFFFKCDRTTIFLSVAFVRNDSCCE